MTIPPWIPARLTAELRAVASELSYWREKHDGRGRIPESIWAEAVAIAQLEGPIPVAAVLQLPLDSLTQRGGAGRQTSSPGGATRSRNAGGGLLRVTAIQPGTPCGSAAFARDSETAKTDTTPATKLSVAMTPAMAYRR